MRFGFLQSLMRMPREVQVLSFGLGLLLGAIGIETTAAYARPHQSGTADVQSLISEPNFTAARCPLDWAQIHGRMTGIGTDGMVDLLYHTAQTHSASSVRSALLAFRARPLDLRYQSAEDLAQLQVFFCLAEAWGLSLKD